MTADQEMAVDDLHDSCTTRALVDGIVISPPHCAYDDCISELANSRGGSFCALHEFLHGTKCCVINCNIQKVAGTQVCEAIKHNGIGMLNIIIGIPLLEQEECCKDQINNYLGNLQYRGFINLMMSLLLISQETIISLQITSTVCKPYVLHVVLLLHGQHLQKQSHQQIS